MSAELLPSPASQLEVSIHPHRRWKIVLNESQKKCFSTVQCDFYNNADLLDIKSYHFDISSQLKMSVISCNHYYINGSKNVFCEVKVIFMGQLLLFADE